MAETASHDAGMEGAGRRDFREHIARGGMVHYKSQERGGRGRDGSGIAGCGRVRAGGRKLIGLSRAQNAVKTDDVGMA